MSETMHIQNLFTRIATLNLRQKTRVKYTQASGLPDWEGVITGQIKGTASNPTTQIPNVNQAQTIRIGDNVTNIGPAAFRNCSSLTNVTIPGSVTSIEGSTFWSCSGLTNMTIPYSVTSIGRYAFYDCTNLSIFDFRKSTSVPTLVNVDAFYNTPSNKEIIVPDSLYDQWIAASNWNSDTNNIRPCIVKASQSSLGVLNPTKVRYTQASGLPDAEFSIVGTIEGQDEIPYCTDQISDVFDAESIQIGNDVTSIGQDAFYSCTNLTEITIPDSVTSIGRTAFENCQELVNVVIPDSVTTMGDGVFYECLHLAIVEIGSGVTNIGVYMFYDCINCATFDFRRSTQVPTLADVNAFYDTPSNKEIIVPDSLYDSWRAASNWSSSTNNIVNCIVKASQSSLGSLT